MSYKESLTYVQRQIDQILQDFSEFVKAYIDNIIIFSETLNKHLDHLKKVFIKLTQMSIFLKEIKLFIEYLIVILLRQ